MTVMVVASRTPLKRRRSDAPLVLAGGKNGAWTPHDLRRTGATMMQALGISLELIDRCQNHVLAGSKVAGIIRTTTTPRRNARHGRRWVQR